MKRIKKIKTNSKNLTKILQKCNAINRMALWRFFKQMIDTSSTAKCYFELIVIILIKNLWEGLWRLLVNVVLLGFTGLSPSVISLQQAVIVLLGFTGLSPSVISLQQAVIVSNLPKNVTITPFFMFKYSLHSKLHDLEISIT